MAQSPTTPTLDDVAHAAGVSTATVSRCLNMPDRVAETTRVRVMDAVERLGYTPNFAARVMAAKRTMTIGAIVPTLENAIFARCLQGFQEELHAAGYTLLMASSSFRQDLEHEQIKALAARGADGLLLIGHDRDPAIYDYLTRQGVSTVIGWTYDMAKPQISVGFDNHAAMFALAQKVLELGHERVGVVSGVQVGNDRVRHRIQGVKDAAAARGIDPAGVRVLEASYDLSGGVAAFDQLMNGPIKPTAIMCVNDVLAAGVMHRAQSRGFRVPDDVSITGFDDIELAGLMTPELCTVHVPHSEMGRSAARELVAMVGGTRQAQSVELHTSLRLRGSLGPAPN